MSKSIKIFLVVLTAIGLSGCSGHRHHLGMHVAELKAEQTYNPQATLENLGYIPSGSGERMEGAYQIYTGKPSQDLSGTDSQFIEGFSK